MQTSAKCSLLLGVVLAATTALAADGDDIDRIVAAVGVDSMHSVDEEPRMREALAEALADVRRKNPNATFPQPDSAEFDVLVKQAVEGQQRLRRDPLVLVAYRTTLSRMLSPSELAQPLPSTARQPDGRRILQSSRPRRQPPWRWKRLRLGKASDG